MALNSQKRRFPARAVGYRIYFVDLAAETGLCKRDWALPLGSSGILQVVDNIITRTSHHESFTMSCTGYILNDKPARGSPDLLPTRLHTTSDRIIREPPTRSPPPLAERAPLP